MKINLRLLRIYLAKIYPRYNLASIIKFLVHRNILNLRNVFLHMLLLMLYYIVNDLGILIATADL